MSAPFLRIVSTTGKAMPAYRYRDAPCTACGGDGLEGFNWSDGWPDTRKCSECEGSGDTQAACAYCARVAPLDGENCCRDCSDEDVTELPSGWNRVAL